VTTTISMTERRGVLRRRVSQSHRISPRRRTPAAAATAILAAGLIVFGAVAPATAQEHRLDIDGFLSLVETNSLQLENARTDRALAEVQEQLVRTQIYPVVGGQLGYSRNFTDIEQQVPAYADGNADSAALGVYPIRYQELDINRDNDFTLGVSVQQKLFDMTVFRALDASRQFTTLTGTAYEATRQNILTAAKRLYFQALLLQEVVRVRETSEENAYDNYVETQRRLDNGLASPLELLRAEVNWKITQPDTSQARRNLNVALQNLKNFAGLEQNEEVLLDGALDVVPPLPDFSTAATAIANRPDYRVLLNQQRLRKLNISAERAKFYPSLSASLNYGRQASSDEFDLSDSTDNLTAGLTLTIPIFYGGSRFATLKQAQLELRRTTTEVALTEDSIATELETIRLTLEEANLRVESAQQTLQTAERAFEVSETSLESGLASQLELKDARVSLEQARLNYLSAVFDYLSAYFDWQLATGNGGARLPGGDVTPGTEVGAAPGN
jgi:outer membrane protein